MAAEKVKGKLFAAAYVGGTLRQAGEEVEVKAELAEAFFGTPEQLKAKAEAEEAAKKKADKTK
jgi:hypothetical protein